VFVVGKGGVGKSTTAAALALAFAERGEETHLVSTDPAHSVGDIFGKDLGAGDVESSPCSALLTLEEFDARRHADRWLTDARGPISELVERGTYLDREDVRALLDCSLPGVDEVMAALRIADLAARPLPARVVIDTAPTGHTLRLLNCGDVLRGWVAAIAAMAAKASAVGFGLTGRRPRFAGAAVIERLRDQVSRFTDSVLGEADFVVVTRADAVVTAETDRLVADLRRRKLRVAAIVGVGGDYAADYESQQAGTLMTVPMRRDMLDCEGLRAWGTAGDAEQPAPLPSGQAGNADPFALLPPRSLMFFAGKGGVGKSTCAAAYAVAVSSRRNVSLLSTDPAGSLSEVFDRPVDEKGIQVAPGLTARQLDAEAEFARFRATHRDRIRRVFEGLGLADSALLDRAVLESIVDMAPPGLDEVFAVDALLDGLGSEDVLVLDTAPTGHFLRLLQTPALALEWTHALLRVLLKYRSVVGLDGLAQDLLVWARRLKRLLELLGNPEHTGVVIVTLPEALPMRETDRLVQALRRAKLPVAAVLLNRSASTGGAADVSALCAPLVSPSPVGTGALSAFAAQWRAA
jgi:arsenite-transporting ATPase